MISSLRIRNLAIIQDLEIEFKKGFNILTGETGAGKSIIIDGIKLALGEKGTSDLIRTGEKKAVIEAVFSSLKEEKEIYIQREILKSGRSKAYINGTLVPLSKLRELGEKIVDIYGQNDHVFLLFSERHLDFLDSFGGNYELKVEIGKLAKELKILNSKIKELELKGREREQRLDFLNFQINEIESAKLKEKEDEELLSQREILRNAETILNFTQEALNITTQGENCILSQLSQLKNKILKLTSYEEELKNYVGPLEESEIVINELSNSLTNLLEKTQLDPQNLEAIEERLDLIDKLKRKYGNSIEEILNYLERIKLEKKELEGLQENTEELSKKLEEKYNQYCNKAQFLSKKRKKDAEILERQIKKELSLLGMEKAEFKVNFLKIEVNKNEIEKIREKGIDEVEFYLSPNPGEELRPLKKIASGGELSRIMLALKSIGREKETGKTLIFDEIDSGIGGKTAETVARKLKKLAELHQVICITHLPQIASFASSHYRIKKEVIEGRTYTSVTFLDFPQRVKEIARLISGYKITPLTLKNAEEMLKQNMNIKE